MPTETHTNSPEARYAPLKWAVLVSGLGATLAGVRLALQSGRVDGPLPVYTNTSRTFYVSDPVLGWETTSESWFWLGLELTAVVAAIFVGALVIWRVAPRLANASSTLAQRAAPILAIATAIAALLSPAPAVVALTSGLPPEGVLAGIPSKTESLEGAAAGSFPEGTTGRYSVVTEHSNVIAKITAGGETFDGTFTPAGHIEMNPTQLTAESVEVALRVDIASVDTGVEMRSESARDYLKVTEHEIITLSISTIQESRVDASGQKVEIDATAEVGFMGATLNLPVHGIITALDTASRERLGIPADTPGYVLQADMTLHIPDTPLKADLDSFDNPDIPIVTRLVLTLDKP